MNSQLFVYATAVVCSIVLAQQPPRSTFKSSTDVVEVEATVCDEEGRPVAGLAVDDFLLTVDGKPRPIVSASYISAAESDAALGSTDSHGKGVPTPPATRRSIVLAVDEGNIRAGSGREAISAAGALIDHLHPSDRVALLSIPSGPTVDFTTDHNHVRTALARVVGRSSQTHGQFGMSLNELFAFDVGASFSDRTKQREVENRECPPTGGAYCSMELRAEAEQRLQDIRERSRATFGTLSKVLSALGAVSGPKTMILISEGLITRPQGQDTPIISSLAVLAAASRVTLYTVLLDTQSVDVAASRPSSSAGGDRMLEEDGLRTLTSLSGGALFNAIGRSSSLFERIGREMSGYYVVAFEVTNSDRDAKPHRIRFATTKRDIITRARAQFVVPRSDDKDARLMRGLLSSPLHWNTLPLRVGTYTIQDTEPSKVRVIMSVEFPDVPPHGATTRLAYQLTSGDRIVGEDARAVSLEQRPDGAVAPVSWVAFRNLSPGAFTLKVSVAGDDERVGSVTQVVDARLHQFARVTAGDLLLAASAPAGAGPFPVPADASASVQLIAGIELYARQPMVETDAAVRFDVTTLTSDVTMVSANASLAPSGRNRQFARASLPVETLPPGDYLVRARIVLNAAPAGSVERRFRRIP